MTSIPLEISVVSADVLKKPKFFNRPRAYIVVTLAGDSVSRQRTPVDDRNGGKPHWNFTMRFEVERLKLQRNSAVLVFQLRRRRTIGDKDIGSVYVPVKELFDGAGGTNCSRPVAFPVSSRSGKPKGVVYLSYMFGDFPVGTSVSRESRNFTTSALGQGDKGILGQKITRPVRQTTVVGGAERVGIAGRKIPRPVRETAVVGGGEKVGIAGQKIPRPVHEMAVVGGGERVLVLPSAPPHPVPSAPPCPAPSAPYLPIGGYFPVNGPCPSAPYIGQDFGSLI
ncbi:uncharacterized protein LOC131333619 [Rhododendron vialii]|uniref:uncharacterized protein LOC131333619 n=1 Tax=Rhododendron vialii TaxID=182163 RepID=UPI00265ECD4B|nr:uncharacterized protein LOC131333619 [Rhododendron vialii]